jgi:hypothetical protein
LSSFPCQIISSGPWNLCHVSLVFALNSGYCVRWGDSNGMFKVTLNQGFQHLLDGQFADFFSLKIEVHLSWSITWSWRKMPVNVEGLWICPVHQGSHKNVCFRRIIYKKEVDKLGEVTAIMVYTCFIWPENMLFLQLMEDLIGVSCMCDCLNWDPKSGLNDIGMKFELLGWNSSLWDVIVVCVKAYFVISVQVCVGGFCPCEGETIANLWPHWKFFLESTY